MQTHFNHCERSIILPKNSKAEENSQLGNVYEIQCHRRYDIRETGVTEEGSDKVYRTGNKKRSLQIEVHYN
jgi:hypothetical protein